METPKDIETHIDNIFSNLKIFKTPVDLAILSSIEIFEFHVANIEKNINDQFTSEIAKISRKTGFQILIEQIMLKSSNTTFTTDNSQIEISKEMFSSAGAALQFCQRYSIVSLAYWNLYDNLFTAKVNDRVIVFEYSTAIESGRSNLNLYLHDYRSKRVLNKAMGTNQLPLDLSQDKSYQVILESLKNCRVEEIIDNFPENLYALFYKIALVTTETPTISEDIQYHGYTLGEYYKFWLDFSTTVLIYKHFIRKKFEIGSSNKVGGNRSIVCSLKKIMDWVITKGKLKPETIRRILLDLVLDTESNHPDVLIQPIIPLKSLKRVSISPSIITTTNWEVCLLRNWSSNPDQYGKIIGVEKERLSDKLGSIFNKNNLLISTRKKIQKDDGQPVGDVDLAVYDKSDGLLALFELKWVIEPDSPRESKRTRQELEKGIYQIIHNKQEYSRDSKRFLEQIFPAHGVQPYIVKDVVGFVIGYGDVGVKDDVENKVFVLDYTITLEV